MPRENIRFFDEYFTLLSIMNSGHVVLMISSSLIIVVYLFFIITVYTKQDILSFMPGKQHFTSKIKVHCFSASVHVEPDFFTFESLLISLGMIQVLDYALLYFQPYDIKFYIK